MGKVIFKYCSCCKKVHPLMLFFSIGVQEFGNGEIFGMLVNCNKCGTTLLIKKEGNKQYEESISQLGDRPNELIKKAS